MTLIDVLPSWIRCWQLLVAPAPLAFLMEVSDRGATYKAGKWWQARVEELQHMGIQSLVVHPQRQAPRRSPQ